MAKVIPFNEQERTAVREAEQSKAKVCIIMTEEQRKSMLQLISYAAFRIAKDGDAKTANEALDLNLVLASGTPVKE